MGYDYSQAGWSPEVTDYVNGLEQQRVALWEKYAGQNTGLDNPDFLTPQQVQQPASDEIRTEYAPEEVVREYMSRNPLNSANNLNAGVDIRSYGDSRDPSVYDTVRLPYGDDYTFTDKAGGKSYQASTPEQMQAIMRMAHGQSTIGTAPMEDSNYGGGNNIANWEISNGAGERVAYDSPYTPSFLKQAGQYLADQAPAALGAAIGGPLGAAALTSAYKGFGQGASLEDSLKGGAIAGAKVLAMNAIGPYISSGLTSAGLNFPGMDYLFPKDPSFFGALGKNFSVAPNFSGPSMSYSNAIPSGGFSGGSEWLGGLGGLESAVVRPDAGYGSLFSDFVGSTMLPGGVEQAVRSATTSKPAPPATSSLPGFVGSTMLPGGVEQAVRSANAEQQIDSESGLPHVPFTIPDYSYAMEPMDAPATPAKEPSMWDTALKYSPLALALLGAAGSMGGGGAGGADGGTGVYHAPEKLPDIFSAKLPNYNALPSYAPATLNTGGNTGGNSGGAFTGEEDWYTYGRRPEKSFFSNIPGTPIGRAKGGSISTHDTAQQPRSLAVKGPGTGRSDDIPARLSDGEYVMDAETVALLGDGSSKAGADKLDRFRVNVRKHKGKSLAAGRFSVAAKQPEAYLKGRK